MIMRGSHYLTAAFILLASCSSYPQLVTGRSGPLPSPGTYQLAQDSNQTGALENALISRLAEEGFSRSDNARYLVQISFSEVRSEEHTSELQSLMRISYAVFCLQKKKTT